MRIHARTGLLFVASLGVLSLPGIASAQLVDASFENVCTFDPFEGWSKIAGNNFASGDNTRSGARSAFAYPGYFPGASKGNPTGLNRSGFQQSVAVTEGAAVTATGYVKNRCCTDAMEDGVVEFLELAFLDAGGNIIGVPDISAILDTATGGTNTWIEQTVAGVAPAGAVSVRLSCALEQVLVGEPPAYNDGNVHWDDLSLSINGGANVLVNPGFEIICDRPFFNWDSLGGQTFSSNARTGGYSMRLNGPYFFPGNVGGGFQEITGAVEGQQWQGSIWYKTISNEVVSPDIDARLRIEFFDDFGNNLSGATFETADLATVATPTEWTQITTPVATAPFDTTRVRLVVLHALPFYNGGTILYDDAVLSQGTPCAADWNQDDVLNSQDFFDFLIAFFANAADFNNDNVTNSQDFFDFISAFFTGC
ncbi:MAG: hypothetical protein H7210_03885 [Pyrinomonadaceae bacterium]|nr:hypothetical protein [Phycisphaerales bacterium]